MSEKEFEKQNMLFDLVPQEQWMYWKNWRETLGLIEEHEQYSSICLCIIQISIYFVIYGKTLDKFFLKKKLQEFFSSLLAEYPSSGGVIPSAVIRAVELIQVCLHLYSVL